ncbi:MAG: hypothetical protein AAFY54_08835 [Cyanobacteria bacterium J06648_10]
MIDQVLRLFFVVLARGVVWVRPAVPVFCFLIAWSTVAITFWNIVRNLRSGIENVRQMHRIPCARCRYATDSHHLKCSIQPITAFSEDAIGCMDFETDETGIYPQSSLSPSAHF